MTAGDLAVECRLALAEAEKADRVVLLPRHTVQGILDVLGGLLQPTRRIPLTPRQRDILSYVKQASVSGVGPSLQEIADRFGFRSLATVNEHLTKLERKGYIRRHPRLARGLEVVD